MFGIIRNHYRTANTLFGRRSLCTTHNSPSSQAPKTTFPYLESIELGILFLGIFYIPYKIYNEKREPTNKTEESQSLPRL